MEGKTLAVIGLGYVGLPLAVLFGKKYKTIGFDINEDRVKELQQGKDSTLEVSTDEMSKSKMLSYSNNVEDLHHADIYIVTVPTPTDKYNRPVLTPLYKASETVGTYLAKGNIVIYESTVYPGVTEDECVPVLEKTSGLKFNEDFFCGYSPERINPGDKEHTVEKILKVTSGSTPEVAEVVDQLYSSVITAGTFKAKTIKVAEAAKVIENSQRDINIAFVNELAKIFNLLDIDTNDVLEAASTKWNFLPFKPGLVGGHCIGVDPYYLAQKAQEVGYNPEIILAGRRLNDGMGKYVAGELVKLMINNDLKVRGARVLQLGITFKENCPDIRNTRAIDVCQELQDFGVDVTVYDPWANKEEVKIEYGIDLLENINSTKFDAVVLCVAHRDFLSDNFIGFLEKAKVVFDVKGILPKGIVSAKL